MEDNLVEDVSRGASLVVEGMQRNRGETTRRGNGERMRKWIENEEMDRE